MLQYSNLAAQIKVSFNNAFLNTTACSMLGHANRPVFGGVSRISGNEYTGVAGALAAAVQQNGTALTRAFWDRKYLLRALCDQDIPTRAGGRHSDRLSRLGPLDFRGSHDTVGDVERLRSLIR